MTSPGSSARRDGGSRKDAGAEQGRSIYELHDLGDLNLDPETAGF